VQYPRAANWRSRSRAERSHWPDKVRRAPQSQASITLVVPEMLSHASVDFTVATYSHVRAQKCTSLLGMRWSIFSLALSRRGASRRAAHFATSKTLHEFRDGPAGIRTRMTGLEDPATQFMSCRGIAPCAGSPTIIVRVRASNVVECRRCGGQNGGQTWDHGYSILVHWLETFLRSRQWAR
jgi:hypothetical protein